MELFCKKNVIGNIRNITQKQPLLEFLFIKVAGLKAGVSSEIFENFKNNFLRTSANNCSCEPQKNKSIACMRKTDVRQ